MDAKQLNLFKVCNKCKIEKTINEYHKAKKGIHTNCKSCRNIDRRKYPGGWAESNLKTRKYIWEYKKNNPCVQCGEKDPIVLIFDHLRDKDKNVSKMTGFNLEKLKREIEKCQILCANCHARLTAKQFDWYKDLIQEDS